MRQIGALDQSAKTDGNFVGDDLGDLRQEFHSSPTKIVGEDTFEKKRLFRGANSAHLGAAPKKLLML